MAIPELDLKKVNLQAAVGYLISLHDNEVDWNLLGIRVIGHIDALPIPEGTYEYGDAYMVGTKTPYDMYIYTRPDGAVHTEGYWFPVGKFPMPGPQGPKGDGVETFTSIDTGSSQNATYDITDGISATYDAIISYKDSTTGESKSQTVSLNTKTPILPGKYISIDNHDSRNVEVGVDDTALALDYVKIDKTKNSVVPLYLNGSISWTQVTESSALNSIAYRNGNGDCSFRNIGFDSLSKVGSDSDKIYYSNLFYNCTAAADLKFSKRPNDTGTIELTYLQRLKNNVQMHIVYEDKVYYRMDSGNAPAGTLNYIHIDSIQDGNGAYKATGKCFSITVGTREFHVFDLDFGGDFGGTYKHVTQMHVVIPGDDDYYLTVFTTDNHGAMYNLNSASTLLDNIGTAGTMAYKQNTANAVYIPVHISKTSSGNWEWNMGSASGIFTTAQIDTITDDYEILG